MEVFRSNGGSRAWSIHGNPISTSSKCQRKCRSIAVPRAIGMAAPQRQPSGNGHGNGNGNEKEEEVDVLEMITSGVEKKPWWTPIFSFGNPPPARTSASSSLSNEGKAANEAVAAGDRAGKKSKSAVVFTEEKARLLRRQMRATEVCENHGMYHSAIASRLALRFPDEKSS